MPSAGKSVHNTIRTLCGDFIDEKILLREKCVQIDDLQKQINDLTGCTGSEICVGGSPGGNSQNFKYKIAECSTSVPGNGEIMLKCDNQLLVSCKNCNGDDITGWLNSLKEKGGFFNLFKNGCSEQLSGTYQSGASQSGETDSNSCSSCCQISCSTTCC